MQPAIIIPVHNRRDTTLACLQRLRDDNVFTWAKVIVVDDGSTDSTADAIRAQHPEVTILSGDGNLWWGGAINLGMDHALAANASHLIWLNDDCRPRPGTLHVLWQTSVERSTITTARTFLSETGELGYSGMVRCPRTLLRMVDCGDNEVKACETFGGNCVVIPAEVVRRLSGIDTSSFPHTKGDVDFGLRAFDCGVVPLVVGAATCDSTYGYLKNRMSWWFGEISVPELWRINLRPPSGLLSINELHYAWRHHGGLGLLCYTRHFTRLVVVSLARMIVPQSWLTQRFGHLSDAHQRMEKVRLQTSVPSP